MALSISSRKMASRKMNAKQASLWERVRTRGKARFIMMNGGLGLGSTAILSILISSLLHNHPLTWSHLGLAVVICPLLGLVGGNILWNRSEAAYQDFIDRKLTHGR